MNDVFTVAYQPFGTSVVKKIQINALTKKERAARFTKPIDTKKWSLRQEENIYVMKLGTFATWKWKNFDYKEWFAAAFQKINSSTADVLVIDIRGNEGGLGAIREELLSYLISEPLLCNPEEKVLARTVKVDPALQPYSETWVKDLFTGLPTDSYKKYDDTFYELSESLDCKTIQPKENRFKKQVYILGGTSNVSATFQLLQKGKDLENVHFVGTETGGNKQGINGGAYIFFYLPYSKMEVDIPLKFFSGGPNQPYEGIQPDYFVRYTQKDIHQNKDPHIDFVKELTQNNHQLTAQYITRLLESEHWKGSLTYLDYSSQQKVSIPAALTTTMTDANTTQITYLYPDEPHKNSTQTLQIDLAANTIEDREITSITHTDGIVTIVATKDGKDADQPVHFKYTYHVSQHTFSIFKESKPIKSNVYTFKNFYEFHR
ncbi:MAG: S41 family peptidase [Bacteroidota bacterium]